MMSRWFALRPISSSKGRSHSMRTSIVCTIRKILDTFSNPTIHSMYRSSIASRNGRLSRLSILGIGCVTILSLSLNATVPIKIPVVSQTLHTCPNIYCVSRTYSKPQPVIQVNAPTSLYLTHLKAGCRSLHCPNTSLVSPGLTPNLSLSRYSQCPSPGRLSEPSLSKHLTCVSRTYSQPQPVEILQSFQNMSSLAIT